MSIHSGAGNVLLCAGNRARHGSNDVEDVVGDG